MKKRVWKNKSNGQLCVTIPNDSDIRDGDIVEINKASIKKIAYSGTVADLFHYGHLRSIQFAKSISDYSVCGVLTDKAVEKNRAKPIANFKERKAIITALKCVDRVMTQSDVDPTDNLRKLHEEFPEAKIMIVHGSDWKFVPGSDYVKSIGGDVIQHPYYSRLSNYKIMSKVIDYKDKLKDVIDFASLVSGEASLGSDSQDINKVIISTKAKTLEALKPLLKLSKIEDIFVFTVSDWKNRKESLIKEISNKYSPSMIVVRSSAVNEDTLENSMAGCYESELDVDSSSKEQVEEAIKRVIKSYKSKNSESSFNQVLIQTHTQNIIMSGVIFTRTLENNAPYYVINYDNSTGKSDTVTKGVEGNLLKISRFVDASKIPIKFKRLLGSVKEIEEKVQGIGLDIEFAIDTNGEIIIFQVRPLTTSLKNYDLDDDLKEKISILKKKFTDFCKKKEHLTGNRTIFADMPDWNPAEIIGDNPHHLDYSLYDYIITASSWHQARTSQGYYNVDPGKLVVLFGNKPYIDVRHSFNSFVPAALSQELRGKLVDFYLNKLEKNPELQDKVEFDIVYSCFDFCFDDRSTELIQNGFSSAEVIQLKKSLIKLTNNLIKNSKESIKDDLKSITDMGVERGEIRLGEIKNVSVGETIKNAKSLLDKCKEKGTVEFSRLARLAFIGKIILKSMVKKGIIDETLFDNFMRSIRTVATEIDEDFKMMHSGNISKEEFIKKYYHLRPGSYDICSLRYESNPSLLGAIPDVGSEIKSSNFELTPDIENIITGFLKKKGMNFSAKYLFDFCRDAITAREFSKFEFTKNLSDSIELISKAGYEMGFTRLELSMLDINDILSDFLGGRNKLTRGWKELIKLRMKERELNGGLVLPPLIFSEDDFDIIEYYKPRPNYITQKTVKSEIVELVKDGDGNFQDVKGKVVLIENGDPGYDWIFTRDISGLITKYGGVASHMSIRCAEFGIPAAIGCGVIFDSLRKAKGIILDCKFKKITPMGGGLTCW
ncbi:MAG: adenylyltransferase/cytidyltransferase family protein [Nanoarchaeota archaeon]|nr:adenylyltransferase/cytidyltransferase family protein [Nanoarchaeota archaeon]